MVDGALRVGIGEIFALFALALAVLPSHRAPMLTRRLQALFVLLFCGAAWFVACDLNPQPLPPGESADEDAGAEFGGGNGGGLAAADAGTTSSGTSTEDAGSAPGQNADAGDSGAPDAGAGSREAGADGAADAAEDSPSDGGQADAGEDGG